MWGLTESESRRAMDASAANPMGAADARPATKRCVFVSENSGVKDVYAYSR
jgi:hypothetical protein